VGDRSRGRFAMYADFPRHDVSPYSHVHARRESLGFVHRSRAIFCRPVPNLSVTIRNFCIAVHGVHLVLPPLRVLVLALEQG
jgi:hypothetical protein